MSNLVTRGLGTHGILVSYGLGFDNFAVVDAAAGGNWRNVLLVRGISLRVGSSNVRQPITPLTVEQKWANGVTSDATWTRISGFLQAESRMGVINTFGYSTYFLFDVSDLPQALRDDHTLLTRADIRYKPDSLTLDSPSELEESGGDAYMADELAPVEDGNPTRTSGAASHDYLINPWIGDWVVDEFSADFSVYGTMFYILETYPTAQKVCVILDHSIFGMPPSTTEYAIMGEDGGKLILEWDVP